MDASGIIRSKMIQSIAWGLLMTTLLANIYLRFSNRDMLFTPDVDSTSYTYWAQLVANASHTGVGVALTSPGDLIRHPESKMYQALALPYIEPTRVFNLAGVLIFATWMSLWSSSLSSAQVLSSAMGVLLGFSAAHLAVRLACAKQYSAVMMSACVFTLVVFNPWMLSFTTSPSWHCTACTLLLGAYALAKPEWKSASWSRSRAVVIWVLLVSAIYSVTLIPGLFISAWAGTDIYRAQHSQAFNRTALYWLSVVIMALPGLAYVASRPTTAVYWANALSTGHVASAARSFAYANLITLFCLPLLVALPKSLRSASEPLLVFVAVWMLAFCMIWNQPGFHRVHIHLIPVTAVLATVVAFRRRWSAVLIGSLAFLLAIANMASPRWVFNLVCPGALKQVATSYAYQEVARAMSFMDLAHRVVLFEKRDEAVQVLSRLNDPKIRYIFNLGKYLNARSAGTAGTYLDRYYPGLSLSGSTCLLVTLHEPEKFAHQLAPYFDVLAATTHQFNNPFLSSADRWFLMELSPKEQSSFRALRAKPGAGA